MSIRPRGVGEILDGAFRLYKEDAGLYILTAIVASLPWGLLMVATVTDSGTGAVLALILMPVAVVLMFAVWAALMEQMNERLEGREPELGPSIKRGMRLFFRVAWGAFLSYLVIMAALFVSIFGAGLVGAIAGAVAGEVVGTVAIAVTALVLVFFIFVRAFAGAVLFLPGIVVEGLTGYAALKRGYALAQSGRGRIVGVVAVSWIIVFVPFVATYFITGTTAALYDPEAMASGLVTTGQFAAQQLLAVVASGFTTPFLVACILLLHYDQRVRREAFDLEAEADALAG